MNHIIYWIKIKGPFMSFFKARAYIYILWLKLFSGFSFLLSFWLLLSTFVHCTLFLVIITDLTMNIHKFNQIIYLKKKTNFGPVQQCIRKQLFTAHEKCERSEKKQIKKEIVRRWADGDTKLLVACGHVRASGDEVVPRGLQLMTTSAGDARAPLTRCCGHAPPVSAPGYPRWSRERV